LQFAPNKTSTLPSQQFRKEFLNTFLIFKDADNKNHRQNSLWKAEIKIADHLQQIDVNKKA